MIKTMSVVEKKANKYLKDVINITINKGWIFIWMVVAICLFICAFLIGNVFWQDFVRSGFIFSVMPFCVVMFFLMLALFCVYLSFRFYSKIKDLPTILRITFPGWNGGENGKGRYIIFVFKNFSTKDISLGLNKVEEILLENYNVHYIPTTEPVVNIKGCYNDLTFNKKYDIYGIPVLINMSAEITISFSGTPATLFFYRTYGHSKEAMARFKDALYKIVNKDLILYYFDIYFPQMKREYEDSIQVSQDVKLDDSLSEIDKARKIVNMTKEAMEEKCCGKSITLPLTVAVAMDKFQDIDIKIVLKSINAQVDSIKDI